MNHIVSYIVIVVGDIGACKELIPVAAALQQRGCHIEWKVDTSPQARASDTLESVGILYDTVNPYETVGGKEILFHGDIPDLILIGTSATATAAQRHWTRFGRDRRIPVIWYEDLYGTSNVVEMLESVNRPNAIIVIDETAKKIVEAVRGTRIRCIVGGKPTYADSLRPYTEAYTRAHTREATRRALGLDPDRHERLVVYVSMGEDAERVSKHLDSIGRAFYGSGDHPPIHPDTRIVPCIHPKLREQIPGMGKTFCNYLGRYCLSRHGIDTLPLIVSADLVITDYAGDAPYQSAAVGVPAIVLLYPDCTLQMSMRGYQNGLPPIIDGQAAWAARNEDELRVLTAGILAQPHAARICMDDARRKFIRHLFDPNAAQGIADIVSDFKR